MAVGLLCPGDGALFGIAHAHIYMSYFPCGWRNLRQDVFWKRTQNSGERRSNDSKEQQPQRASLLGIGDGASLASPLSRSKACIHSYYTRPETAMRQSQSGYFKHGTTGIMKVVNYGLVSFILKAMCVSNYIPARLVNS